MAKKKQVKKQIKRVGRYIDKWLKPLGLLWWYIDVRYVDDKKTIKKYFAHKDAALSDVVAIVFADWRYSKAAIYINLPVVKTMDEDELEDAILHELSHILVSEMRAEGIDHEERVVTGLTKAFLWTEAEFTK